MLAQRMFSLAVRFPATASVRGASRMLGLLDRPTMAAAALSRRAFVTASLPYAAATAGSKSSTVAAAVAEASAAGAAANLDAGSSSGNVTLHAVGPTTTLVRSTQGYSPFAAAAPRELAIAPKAFVVVEIASKQYKVTCDDVIVLNKLKGTDIGQTLLLDRVLLAGGKDYTLIGRPYIDSEVVKVTATVIEQAKGAKVIAFKFRRRKNSKRTRGHRQELTVLRVSGIEVQI